MSVSGRTVLVVEDDFSSREVLVMLLEGEGLDVSSASDGEEALKRVAEARGIALIVTDYMMPRLNGVELCRRLAADPQTRAIPVILMSATFVPKDVVPEQVVAIFGKPLLFDTLLAKVREVLGPEGS